MDGVEVSRSYSDTLVLSDSRLPVVVRRHAIIKRRCQVSVLICTSPLAYSITGTNLVAPYELFVQDSFSKIVKK